MRFLRHPRTRGGIWAIAAIAAVTFMILPEATPSVLRILTKLIPGLALTLLSLTARRSARWFSAGLAFATLGDVLLETRDPGLFGGGVASDSGALLSFLAASWSYTKRIQPGFLVVSLILMGGYFWWLSPFLGTQLIALAAYTSLYVVLLWRAFAALSGRGGSGARWFAVGALLISASDMVLGVVMFVHSGWWGRTAVMTLWWGGLALLALAAITPTLESGGSHGRAHREDSRDREAHP